AVVNHSQSNRIMCGRPNNATDGLEDIAQVFREAGSTMHTTDNIRRAIWTKLVGNAGLSPVAALSLSDARRMLIDDPLVRNVVLAILDETTALGNALGLPPDPILGDSAQRMRDLQSSAADFKPSMLQDIERNIPIELNAIAGATVEIADKLGH